MNIYDYLYNDRYNYNQYYSTIVVKDTLKIHLKREMWKYYHFYSKQLIKHLELERRLPEVLTENIIEYIGKPNHYLGKFQSKWYNLLSILFKFQVTDVLNQDIIRGYMLDICKQTPQRDIWANQSYGKKY